MFPRGFHVPPLIDTKTSSESDREGCYSDRDTELNKHESIKG